MGRVDGVFVEARPGVLVEKSLATPSATGATWVSVALHVPTEDGRMAMSARVDDGVNARAGDLVAVRVGSAQPSLAAGPRADAVVAAVIATHDRVYATHPAGGSLRRVNWTEELH